MRRSQTDPERRQRLTDQLNEIIDENRENERHWRTRFFQFLTISNGGGAAATLGFMGALPDWVENLLPTLGAFVLGLLALGIGLLAALLRASAHLHKVIDIQQRWHRNLITVEEGNTITSTDRRVLRVLTLFVLPIVPLVFFAIGIGLAITSVM